MSELSSQITLGSPDVSWRDGVPIADQFSDPYFSADDGLAESRYVFLQQNGLPKRWHTFPWEASKTFNIIETGFGTGLNFLATWQAWTEFQTHSTHFQGWLHVTSIEKFPLTKEQIAQALSVWPELTSLSHTLLEHYPLPLQGAHHLVWPEERLSLTLWFGDIQHVLPQLNVPVHAWYLDGFAPARNPEMWNETLFLHLRRLSHQAHQLTCQTTVATFTAAGIVKRALQGSGFNIKKVKGFGRKRDMLAGEYRQTIGAEQPNYYHHYPWLVSEQQSPGQIIIVGAGLAGSFTARALAERGWRVSVFDEQGIANSASGNRQGGLYIKLSTGQANPHSDFYLQAYQYALSTLPRILGKGDANNPYWHQCGLLQLAYNSKEQIRQQKYLAAPLPTALIQPLTAEQASKQAGSDLAMGGLFYPNAGWIAPKRLCEQLLDHPNIRFTQQKIIHIQEQKNKTNAFQHWIVNSTQQSYQAKHLILANAAAAQNLLPDFELPLKNIRGQMTHLSAKNAPSLRTVLSGRGYVSPPLNHQLCVGATFSLNDSNAELTLSDHQENVQSLKDFGKDWQEFSTQSFPPKSSPPLDGRVGFRCTAPDYLPLIGRLPIAERFQQDFKKLQQNSNAIANIPCQQYPNLWLNIAHGAKGLASTPLAGEILACAISNAAQPISQELNAALWPGRFLMRDMIRRKHGR